MNVGRPMFFFFSFLFGVVVDVTDLNTHSAQDETHKSRNVNQLFKILKVSIYLCTIPVSSTRSMNETKPPSLKKTAMACSNKIIRLKPWSNGA